MKYIVNDPKTYILRNKLASSLSIGLSIYNAAIMAIKDDEGNIYVIKSIFDNSKTLRELDYPELTFKTPSEWTNSENVLIEANSLENNDIAVFSAIKLEMGHIKGTYPKIWWNLDEKMPKPHELVMVSVNGMEFVDYIDKPYENKRGQFQNFNVSQWRYLRIHELKRLTIITPANFMKLSNI